MSDVGPTFRGTETDPIGIGPTWAIMRDSAGGPQPERSAGTGIAGTAEPKNGNFRFRFNDRGFSANNRDENGRFKSACKRDRSSVKYWKLSAFAFFGGYFL